MQKMIEEECTVCLQRLTTTRQRMVVCPQQHPICRKCVDDLPAENEFKKCPTCRFEFGAGS